MKIPACWMSIVIVCCVSSGCRPSERVTPLGAGYEEVTFIRTHISELEAHQITLQFRSPPDERAMVWPSLESATVVKNGIAVFVAVRTVGWSKLDQMWETGPRLFAVKAPDAPLDITSEVVGRWARASGKDIAKALNSPAPIEPKEQDGKLNVPFDFGIVNNWPGADISLSWDELSDIMHEVRKKGVQHKDPKWNLIYYEKEFNVDEHK